MNSNASLLGSWIADQSPPTGGVSKCIWHFIDERTLVADIQIDEGNLVTWYQYWPDVGGILRYPLSLSTRSMFKTAERVLIGFEKGNLRVNVTRDCLFYPIEGLPVPERYDLFLGTCPDQNGLYTTAFKSKLQEYLDKPPRGEEGGPSNGAIIPPHKF